MSENIPPPDSGDPTDDNNKPGKSRRSDYDQKLANDITEAGTLIANALKDADVLAALSYSEAELREGEALQVAAQAAFGARQNAQGSASAVRETRDALADKVTDEFKAFRTTVQNGLPESARTPLGASGRLPVDLQKLGTLLESSYGAAKLPAYLPALEKRKLSLAIFDARLVEAKALQKLDGDFKAADKGATIATKTRDEAGEAMRKWVTKFRKQAKSDLRHHPHLLAKLGM